MLLGEGEFGPVFNGWIHDNTLNASEPGSGMAVAVEKWRSESMQERHECPDKNTIFVGTWGGTGGSTWDDGIFDGVRKITLVYGSCIASIQVVYDYKGKPVSTENHGLNVGQHRGTQIAQIKLQFPEEFLTIVTGYFDLLTDLNCSVIQSLTFKSNLRTFGPFGVESGTPFSFAMEGQKILGFKGRSGWYLDAIGIHITPINIVHTLSLTTPNPTSKDKNTIFVGPWGGTGGNTWDDGIFDGVRKITLVYGSCIASIQVVYDNKGKPVSTENHGLNVGQHRGTQIAQIKLEFPEEFLTIVTGYFDLLTDLNCSVIQSLTFKSNLRTFGPFGVERGTPFSFAMEGQKILGFKGRSGWYLDAIGIHITPINIVHTLSLTTPNPTSKDQKTIFVGPWGDPGGHDWDDGIFDGVREITLMYGACIASIQVVYDNKGRPVSAENHGLNVGQHRGTQIAQIKLQFPEEFLTIVTGHFDTLSDLNCSVIQSLTFKTNLRTFGPFGVESGTPFSFAMEGRNILGFKGRSGWYLDAIGFHRTPVNKVHTLSLPTPNPTSKDQKKIFVGPWGGPGGSDWDDGSFDGVREIKLVYGSCIASIQVVYDNKGKAVSAENHGLNVGQHRGTQTAQIKLEFPDEFLTNVTGYFDLLRALNCSVIQSLTFKSNLRTFGPFGVEGGTPFSFPMEGGKILGFKGRSGWYLDAIGFHITPVNKVNNLA